MPAPVTILSDPAYVVPPVPPAGPVGTVAWLRATVSRFSSGAVHARRRAVIEARLAGLDAERLRILARSRPPLVVLAAELGFAEPARAAATVAVVALAYHPGTWADGADEAVAELVAPAPAEEPEAIAQDIALLVQACAPVAALIAHGGDLTEPPVPVTLRLGPEGVVAVDLRGIPFGAGPRSCPGRSVALALVRGALEGATPPLSPR